MLIALVFVIAVAAAVRSTWSPCGVSMLSTLTPLGERGRGHRWLPTAVCYLAGAILGGATLGLAMAGLAALRGGSGLDSALNLPLFSVLALVAAAFDSHIGGLVMPGSRRQVNELWLNVYRPWVYSGGFGWQIGTGMLTYLMTSGVYLLVLGAALIGDPTTALLAGVVFGGVRGLFVFAGAGLDTGPRLAAFHRRFERLRAPSVVAMVAVLSAVAVAAAGAVGIGWGTTSAVLGVVFVVTAVRAGRVRPSAAPRISTAPSAIPRTPTT